MNFIFSLLLLVPLSVKIYAQESTNGPETMVKNIFTLAQKENPLTNLKIKTELDSKFDFNKMSLNILGDESKKRSAEELKWFQDSIKEIITKTVYPKAPDFLQDVKITYKKTLVDGDKATVSSSVSKKGEHTDVAYTLVKSSTNDWKIVDVSVDDESWTEIINDKLTQSIRQKGWIGVKELINKRLKNLDEKK